MSEPCKNCERCGSAECLERVGSMRPQETLAWMAHYLTCAQRTYARALAAEKQLATLQQTVDAIVKERDALRGKVARVSAWAVAYGNGADLYMPAVADTMRHASNKVTFLLNDKETP